MREEILFLVFRKSPSASGSWTKKAQKGSVASHIPWCTPREKRAGAGAAHLEPTEPRDGSSKPPRRAAILQRKRTELPIQRVRTPARFPESPRCAIGLPASFVQREQVPAGERGISWPSQQCIASLPDRAGAELSLQGISDQDHLQKRLGHRRTFLDEIRKE